MGRPQAFLPSGPETWTDQGSTDGEQGPAGVGTLKPRPRRGEAEGAVQGHWPARTKLGRAPGFCPSEAVPGSLDQGGCREVSAL